MQPQTPSRTRIINKVKPASGFASLLHVLYRIALPIVVIVLVRLDVGIWLPLLVILLSKWRIFAVRPRFWPANIRANAVDIMVGVSIVIFMAHAGSLFQALWVLLYAVWLVYIKPSSTVLFMSLQSAIGQLFGLSALFIVAGETLDFNFGRLSWTVLPIGVLVILAGLICYLSARHFFDSFNEPYAKMLAYLWGYFAAALIWVLAHMLIVYPHQDGVIAQPTLVLSAISYSLGAVYYLEHFDRLSKLAKKELLFIGSSIVVILLISLLYEGAHLIV